VETSVHKSGKGIDNAVLFSTESQSSLLIDWGVCQVWDL